MLKQVKTTFVKEIIIDNVIQTCKSRYAASNQRLTRHAVHHPAAQSLIVRDAISASENAV